MSEILRMLPDHQRKQAAELIDAGKVRSHVGSARLVFDIDEVREDLARLLPPSPPRRGADGKKLGRGLSPDAEAWIAKRCAPDTVCRVAMPAGGLRVVTR